MNDALLALLRIARETLRLALAGCPRPQRDFVLIACDALDEAERLITSLPPAAPSKE